MDTLPVGSLTIQVLEPGIGRDDALHKLLPQGFRGVLRRWAAGRFLALSDFYIPYHLYRVTCQDRGSSRIRHLAIDAASGRLDPYEFGGGPKERGFVEIGTTNLVPSRLAKDQTRALVLEKSRRLLFAQGLFRLREPVIAAELEMPEFYIPYWAGFFGNENAVDVIVLDALGGTVQGGKVRQMLTAWLMEKPSPGPARSRTGSTRSG